MKVEIKKIVKGKNAGQHRFLIKGDNGEIIATSESYKNLGDLESTVKKYFTPNKWYKNTESNRELLKQKGEEDSVIVKWGWAGNEAMSKEVLFAEYHEESGQWKIYGITDDAMVTHFLIVRLPED